MSTVETKRTGKKSRNAGDKVAKYQERTAAGRDVGLITVQEME